MPFDRRLRHADVVFYLRNVCGYRARDPPSGPDFGGCGFGLGEVPRGNRTPAPLPAKTRAMPFPIPLLAPVTMTERPSIDVSIVHPSDLRMDPS